MAPKKKTKSKGKASRKKKSIRDRLRMFFAKQSAIIYFKGLTYPDAVRFGAVLLSCIAMCLLMISISTEYWVKKFFRGSFISLGLWAECEAGYCSPRKHMPIYVVVALIAMLISAWTCFASVIFGTLCLTPAAKSAHPPITIYLSFISGFAGGFGIFTFMRFSTSEANSFFAWSLIPGWLSMILVSMAGVCHYVARRYEDEETTAELTTTMLLTLWDEHEAEEVETEV